MVGHLAEAGVVIHDDFREGKVAPATQNREFIRACEARRPRGRRIAHVRIDSAGCQADLFNHCEDHGQSFAIGARLDAPTRAAIAAIPESAWKPCADSMVAETAHSMNGPRKAFRLIVVKRAQQAELLEAGVEDDAPRYHVIASNRRESTEATLIWYRQRGDVSENGIKERKLGFGMQCMPCGQFAANAYNLFVLFRQYALIAAPTTHQRIIDLDEVMQPIDAARWPIAMWILRSIRLAVSQDTAICLERRTAEIPPLSEAIR
jgi:hypothetical protein